MANLRLDHVISCLLFKSTVVLLNMCDNSCSSGIRHGINMSFTNFCRVEWLSCRFFFRFLGYNNNAISFPPRCGNWIWDVKRQLFLKYSKTKDNISESRLRE